MLIENVKQHAKAYYGLHFAEGVALYNDGDQPYCVLVQEKAMKQMDASFAGKPVYVEHQEVNLDTLQQEADGYVVKSFFNKTDGKHWAEFLITSDRGHQAIQDGYVLSNAYHVTKEGMGGEWHAVPYLLEVLEGEYDHLALVKNPRYAESVILTPEQFKAYNLEKETELLRIANSKDTTTPKGDPTMAFDFFKKTKVENAKDVEGIMVKLPKSKREGLVTDFLNEIDAASQDDREPYMCNGEELVKVGDEHMKVNDLKAKYEELKNALAGEEKDEPKEKEVMVGKKNKKMNIDEDEVEEEMAHEAKQNEDEDEEMMNKKKKNSYDHARALRNAHLNAKGKSEVIDTAYDQLKRGQERYG